MGLPLSELERTVLPFGVHKGKTFDDTPLKYLDWLSGQDWVRDPLRGRLTAYLTHPTIVRELEKELEDE